MQGSLAQGQQEVFKWLGQGSGYHRAEGVRPRNSVGARTRTARWGPADDTHSPQFWRPVARDPGRVRLRRTHFLAPVAVVVLCPRMVGGAGGRWGAPASTPVRSWGPTRRASCPPKAPDPNAITLGLRFQEF